MRRATWLLPLAASLAAAAPAVAQTARPADTDNIWTVQGENDAASTQRGTSDRYYTSGLRVSWTSGEDTIDAAASVGRAVWGDGHTRVAIDISQGIFTPRNTQISPPDPRDRPYAGILIATGSLIHDTASTRDVVSLALGVVGPSALGEETQNGFHDIIGDPENKGWKYQLQDQIAVQLNVARTWRVPVANFGGIEADLLPNVTLGAGSLRVAAQAGGLARIGQGLESDFGPARILPGRTGTDAYTQAAPIAWYLFGGANGQAVGYDVTLDGSTFRDRTPSVHRTWYVGELEAGAAIIWHGVRLSYTQVFRTQEFRGAKAGLFNYGSLTLSTKF